MSDVTLVNKPLLDMPISAALLAGRLVQETIDPFFTQDLVHLLLEDNVAANDSSHLKFCDVGVEPVSMDKQAFDFLYQYRPGGHFRFVQGYH